MENDNVEREKVRISTFFNTKDVVKLLARIIYSEKNNVKKIYDPNCRAGRLLFGVAKKCGVDAVEKGLCGCISSKAIYRLFKINMRLHRIDANSVDVVCNEKLINTGYCGKFGVIVSNFIGKFRKREKYNVEMDNISNPKNCLDYVKHIVEKLAIDGVAGIVFDANILYSEGIEKEVRKYLIDNNYLDSVIYLPYYRMPWLTICVFILRKNKKDKSIMFINPNENKIKNKDVAIDEIVGLCKRRWSLVNFYEPGDISVARENANKYLQNDVCFSVKVADTNNVKDRCYNLRCYAYIKGKHEIKLEAEAKNKVRDYRIQKLKDDDKTENGSFWVFLGDILDCILACDGKLFMIIIAGLLVGGVFYLLFVIIRYFFLLFSRRGKK